MGTTLTAVYVGEQEVAIAHVGDSRAYCLRDGELLRLTDDHSLVDELMRQGRLTPEEAVEHPQRSVITRALGPEGTVEVDTRSFHARAGDLFLLCSDGLTTMLAEDEIRDFCFAHCTDERKPDETDEQFVYKTRKKAIGPFKRRMWDMGDDAKGPIIRDLEAKFEFLMEKLGVFGTKEVVAKHVPVSSGALPAYAAASDALTAAATVDPNEGE